MNFLPETIRIDDIESARQAIDHLSSLYRHSRNGNSIFRKCEKAEVEPRSMYDFIRGSRGVHLSTFIRLVNALGYEVNLSKIKD